MSATSIDLFLFASSLASASPVGSFGVRAAHSARRVPMGTWVDPGSNEQRDDAVVALAKRAPVRGQATAVEGSCDFLGVNGWK